MVEVVVGGLYFLPRLRLVGSDGQKSIGNS